jgi:hypothetical protein
MSVSPPDGPQPMGRTATRIFVIVLLLVTLALAIWSALFLIRTARESGDAAPAVPDTTTSAEASYSSGLSAAPGSFCG